MPRKPKLPRFQLHIEALSTGKVVHTDEFDDFNGERLAKPVDTSANRPLLGADAIRAAQQQQSEQAKRKLWTMLKPDKVLQPAQPVELIPKGKRKIAEWNGKAVLIDMPKWRRL